MRSFVAVCMTAVLVLCTGCATFGAKDPISLTPSQELLVEVSVQYATGKAIESAKDRAEAAARVRAVATAIQAVASGDATTVAGLKTLAMAEVDKLKLQPADYLAATTLVNFVAAELEARVASGVLSDQDRVLLSKVLDWVLLAVTPYEVKS